MLNRLALATLAFGAIAGIAAAQDTQTTNAAQTRAAIANAQATAAANAKPGEAYEWSVDTTTTKVPVHPTVVEKTTTTTNTPQPEIVNHHTSTTTTTTSGDQ